jgi:hypothetical protein
VGSSEISSAVQEFVLRHIDSIEQLEILLLLRAHRDRPWTAEQVSREIRTAPASAARRLAGLAAAGLLAREAAGDAYRYGPQADDVDRAAGELAETYAVRRIAVTNLIYSRPLDQVRTFADAFKIRED